MISPSFDGTDACSLTSCVLMLSSVTFAAGFTTWMPSVSARPVTRPNSVTTPTCPVGTHDVDENATSTAMPITRSIPTPRMKPFRPPPSARSMENGPRIVPPQLTDEAGYNGQVSALFRGRERGDRHPDSLFLQPAGESDL